MDSDEEAFSDTETSSSECYSPLGPLDLDESSSEFLTLSSSSVSGHKGINSNESSNTVEQSAAANKGSASQVSNFPNAVSANHTLDNVNTASSEVTSPSTSARAPRQVSDEYSFKRDKETNMIDCNFCGMGCSNFFTLFRHKLKSHNYRPAGGYPCRFCDEKFDKVDTLQQHDRKHRNERPYACDLCRSSFSCLPDLQKHKNKVHKLAAEKYICKICNQAFRYKAPFNNHMLTHDEESLLSCDICAKKFMSQHGLKHHKLTHAEDRPKFQCDSCPKKLSTKASLKTHMATHSEERPYECEFCQQKFRMKSHLATHLRFVHPDNGEAQRDYRFECDVCGKKFYNKWNLKVHVKAHSKGTI